MALQQPLLRFFLPFHLLLITLLDRFLEVEILLVLELCMLEPAPQLLPSAVDRRAQLL